MQTHELGELFEQVQLSNVLGDGKTFPDCLPKKDLSAIQKEYFKQKESDTFDLKKFVIDNFNMPKAYAGGYQSDQTMSVEHHVKELWTQLTRLPGYETSSLIPMPNPYVVPGGRFREIYYWDSYFTMEGLRASGRVDLIENMIENFVYLIEKFGYIPNGNRTYYIGRSQPPFFSLMVKLFCEAKKSPELLTNYLPALEKEYSFWMKGEDDALGHTNLRVVKLADGAILNRYWDESATPRPESYREDVMLSKSSSQKPEELFRNIRASAESGWDFSSRWFDDSGSFSSLHTTEIIPIDLNCLLFDLEKTLSEAYRLAGHHERSTHYLTLCHQRKAAIQKYCWSEEKGFFVDYDFVSQTQKVHLTLAATYALFFQIATPNQAARMAEVLEKKFLKHGGLTTTLIKSGQQWDAPNGWAPLQWMAYCGLRNYGFDELAAEVKRRWFALLEKVYHATGKMTEKYDVWNENGEARGGEYPNQDGFGWTNGVYLAMTSST